MSLKIAAAGRFHGGAKLPTLGGVCRSIKTLRPPFTEDVTEADMRAAALQYVRKVSGFRAPAGHNAEAFDKAVETITAATVELMSTMKVRGAPAGRP